MAAELALARHQLPDGPAAFDRFGHYKLERRADCDPVGRYPPSNAFTGVSGRIVADARSSVSQGFKKRLCHDRTVRTNARDSRGRCRCARSKRALPRNGYRTRDRPRLALSALRLARTRLSMRVARRLSA